MEEELERLVEAGKLDKESAKKINTLRPGSYCVHKSWGTGEIASWDLLGDRLIINFEDKPGHGMKLKFAANALEAVQNDHILAQRFKNQGELSELAEKDPVELIRRTLMSHGRTMSLDGLDDVLKGSVVEEHRYKSWWDSTKKKLRLDRRFVVPSKRNLPLELRDSDITPAQAMISDVLQSPDLKAKAKAVEPILKDPGAFIDPSEELLPVAKDLNESARRAAKLMAALAIELLLARDDIQSHYPGLELGDEQLSLAEILRDEQSNLGELVRGLGVARQRQVLEAFPDAFGEQWTSVVFEMLNTAGMRGIGELTKVLTDKGKLEDLEVYLALGLQSRALSSDLIAWICKERKGRSANLVTADLPNVIMASLERDHFDETGRRTNRLAETLQADPELIPDLVKGVDINTVRGFARRLMMSPVFDSLSSKSLLARIVKLHPQIQELITGAQGEEERDDALIVSYSSLEAKQVELNHLVNVLQPQNREEIQIAREYGDLRENFEYKAARQQESVLRRKREDLEKAIGRARPTDFSKIDTSKVSVGTIVEFEDDVTGETEAYTILGAWDSNPNERVIAYTTKAGRALIGKQVGESASLPTEEENKKRRVKIVSIQAFQTPVES